MGGMIVSDGMNILAGKIKKIEAGAYSFCKKGFMANDVMQRLFGDDDGLLTGWHFPYAVNNGKSAVVVLCKDEEELRTAFLSVAI
jgi:hypothetical protein